MDDERLNAELKPLLKYINDKNVKMNEDESKRNVAIVEATVNSLLTAMIKVDKLFEQLYQRIVYTGSYYEGLRVKRATEFDLNIVLRLPFSSSEVQITHVPECLEYLKFQLKYPVGTFWGLHPTLASFFDSRTNVLLRSKVQSWIQSVIDRAWDSSYFTLPSGVTSLQMRQCGPAFTQNIIVNRDIQIDVDLVPVIDGVPYPVPSVIRQTARFARLSPEEKMWFIIPRKYKDYDDVFGRIAFPEADKQLLKSQGCVKMLIKLIKLLRDQQDWDKISSYHIKTLFMLEMDAFSSDAYWHEEKLGILFMKMLLLLRKSVRERRLQYYFNSGYNVLEKLDYATSTNIANRIDRIVADIYSNPRNILTYYGY